MTKFRQILMAVVSLFSTRLLGVDFPCLTQDWTPSTIESLESLRQELHSSWKKLAPEAFYRRLLSEMDKGVLKFSNLDFPTIQFHVLPNGSQVEMQLASRFPTLRYLLDDQSWTVGRARQFPVKDNFLEGQVRSRYDYPVATYKKVGDTYRLERLDSAHTFLFNEGGLKISDDIKRFFANHETPYLSNEISEQQVYYLVLPQNGRDIPEIGEVLDMTLGNQPQLIRQARQNFVKFFVNKKKTLLSQSIDLEDKILFFVKNGDNYALSHPLKIGQLNNLFGTRLALISSTETSGVLARMNRLRLEYSDKKIEEWSQWFDEQSVTRTVCDAYLAHEDTIVEIIVVGSITCHLVGIAHLYDLIPSFGFNLGTFTNGTNTGGL